MSEAHGRNFIRTRCREGSFSQSCLEDHELRSPSVRHESVLLYGGNGVRLQRCVLQLDEQDAAFRRMDGVPSFASATRLMPSDAMKSVMRRRS